MLTVNCLHSLTPEERIENTKVSWYIIDADLSACGIHQFMPRTSGSASKLNRDVRSVSDEAALGHRLEFTSLRFNSSRQVARPLLGCRQGKVG